MKRRDFVQLTGLGLGGLILLASAFGNPVSIEQMLDVPMLASQKKALADVALNSARSGGATYADVRIGRYLNQFINTRENRVQNIANTESFGFGIRVIANGTWGFASTNDVTADGIKRATTRAIAIAKANSKFQKEPASALAFLDLVPGLSHLLP